MSKTTLRKRTAVTTVVALVAGALTAVFSAPIASATHLAAGSTSNTNAAIGTTNGSLMVATVSNLTGAATISASSGGTSGTGAVNGNARSLGLLAKDTSSGTAQTARVLAGG